MSLFKIVKIGIIASVMISLLWVVIWTIVITKGVSYVSEKGLKSVIERVWDGKKESAKTPEDTP